MTFAEAVGRIFDFKGKKFYVVAQALGRTRVSVIDLETSTEVPIYYNHFNNHIPMEWKEILPR